MCYDRKIEYQIEPKEAFEVIHNCAGCGCKANFINTKRFRVNANGNNLDVWLIYQCKKCKHTLNLSVYERVDRKKIDAKEYQLFLQNNEALAEQYGKNYAFFKRNRLEVDWEGVPLLIRDMSNTLPMHNYVSGDSILIRNPYGVRIRPDKMAGMILGISRSAVKRMLESGQIKVLQKGMDLEIIIQ